jgi:hypothetical protein
VAAFILWWSVSVYGRSLKIIGTKRIRAETVPTMAVAGLGKPFEVSGLGETSEVLHISTGES